MKTKLLLVALLAPCMLFAQNGKFTVTGKITAKNKSMIPGKVYLVYFTSEQIADSAIVKKGAYSFTGSISGAAPAYIIFDYANAGLPARSLQGYDYMQFMLGEESIKVTSKDSIRNGVITGSKINDDQKALQAAMAPLEARKNEIIQGFESLPRDQKTEESVIPVRAALAALLPEYAVQANAFIAAHPDSPVSLDAFSHLMEGDWDPKAVQATFNTLSPAVRESAKGQSIAKKIEAEKLTAIGTTAPEFTQNTADGTPVKLSDFRGKYVLIDFWASWCGPCRAENPHVVSAYNQFKDKGFTILGVSLDNDKNKWLEAVKKDGLEWTQVSDLQGWGNAAAKLYGVSGIPANFLIGPDGKVIAKNLRGNDLVAKLAEVLK